MFFSVLEESPVVRRKPHQMGDGGQQVQRGGEPSEEPSPAPEDRVLQPPGGSGEETR